MTSYNFVSFYGHLSDGAHRDNTLPPPPILPPTHHHLDPSPYPHVLTHCHSDWYKWAFTIALCMFCQWAKDSWPYYLLYYQRWNGSGVFLFNTSMEQIHFSVFTFREKLISSWTRGLGWIPIVSNWCIWNSCIFLDQNLICNLNSYSAKRSLFTIFEDIFKIPIKFRLTKPQS